MANALEENHPVFVKNLKRGHIDSKIQNFCLV